MNRLFVKTYEKRGEKENDRCAGQQHHPVILQEIQDGGHVLPLSRFVFLLERASWSRVSSFPSSRGVGWRSESTDCTNWSIAPSKTLCRTRETNFCLVALSRGIG